MGILHLYWSFLFQRFSVVNSSFVSSENSSFASSFASTASIWPFLFQLHHLLLFWNLSSRKSLKKKQNCCLHVGFYDTRLTPNKLHLDRNAYFKTKQNKSCHVAAIPERGCCDVFYVVHFFQRCVVSACKMQRRFPAWEAQQLTRDASYSKKTMAKVYFAQYGTPRSVLWTTPPRLLTRLCCLPHGCGPQGPVSSTEPDRRPAAHSVSLGHTRFLLLVQYSTVSPFNAVFFCSHISLMNTHTHTQIIPLVQKDGWSVPKCRCCSTCVGRSSCHKLLPPLWLFLLNFSHSQFAPQLLLWTMGRATPCAGRRATTGLIQ